MEQTPWEALKSFLREFDHKDGNYSEVTINYATSATAISGSITLRNVFGNIVILEGNLDIDDFITRGILKGNARLLEHFERYEGFILFTSSEGVLNDNINHAKESYFELEIGYGQNGIKIKCTVSRRMTLISNKVTSIEYNREVHDVIPGDVQFGEGDPDVNPDLRGVTIQGGEVRKEIKLDLEKY